MKIRKYSKKDEQAWLRCRVVSFLDSAYFDNVLQKKEIYENPAIELIAEINNQLVGLMLNMKTKSEMLATNKTN
ncbi:MAG: hypothetical protein PWQ09_690 [Candidatus Cloacimonadota bacterium]|jgi:hypothetical protein|nr:hypothetical protein [Candidatus Cloacimonadota bacterium]